LDLWHNPPNENSVTWNDGNCNYHSKSYYCQTVGGKKNKVTSTLPAWKKKTQWKLVMKLDGDATLGFSSAYWTNDALLNENEKKNELPGANHILAVKHKIVAKYPPYRGKKDDAWFAGTVTGINLKTQRVSITYEDGDKTTDAKTEEIRYAPTRPTDWGKGKKRGNNLIPTGAKTVVLEKKFNAKYAEFLKVPFSKIKMCVGKPDANCVEHKFTRDYANAKALFAAGYLRDKTVDQKGILKAFGPAKDSYQSCPMQRPGFNIQCNDGNKARWGYCTNCASQPCQNADSNDADAAIGIGLAGQSTPRQMGGGWTNYMASGKGTCSPNSMTEKHVWFYVFQNLML